MPSSKNLDYKNTSFLSKSNSTFIEEMYLKFINKDSDLPESWKKYFLQIGEELEVVAKEIKGPSWNPLKKKIDLTEVQNKFENKNENIPNEISQEELSITNGESIKAVSLIRSYRQRGHLIADLDPLEMREREYLDELHPESYGFKKNNYSKKIYLYGVNLLWKNWI